MNGRILYVLNGLFCMITSSFNGLGVLSASMSLAISILFSPGLLLGMGAEVGMQNLIL